jgi:DNA mismatch repair protein MutL
MADVIQILPDSVANQIAAGEVVQRPASVIKELMENAIDAGCRSIKVNVKEGGKSLIQVIDDGKGMSETDARMAFERHATSKINSANDLFAIRTMGFRGEALASIAAIAEVNLKTRAPENELGTELILKGSQVVSQEPVNTAAGSNFCIRNLFFNVPARRKFLKTTSTELRHIINEFQRVALSHPGICFELIHNDMDIYNLPPDSLKKRIINLFGKNLNQNLIDIKTKTSIVNISGFIGKPENAKKKFGEQFFFVNNRYMRHPYFHRAIMQAYEKILPPEHVPSYFVYLEIDPGNIDINIHPTKTEIKFEDERSIYQILQATVKEGLGKFNVAPSLDFDNEAGIEIPVLRKNTEINAPRINVNPDYNPFEKENNHSGNKTFHSNLNKDNLLNWENIYSGFEKSNHQDDDPAKEEQVTLDMETRKASSNFMHLKGKFIVTPVKSGLMLIDQKRAHERILFEKFVHTLQNAKGIAQQNLYPRSIELNPEDYNLLLEISDELTRLGFDIRRFGINTVIINGCPSHLQNGDPVKVIEELLEDYKATQGIKSSVEEKVAQSLSKASAINYGKILGMEEMRDLVDNLFACSNPNFSPGGKQILTIVTMEELEKKLK